jgi:hypothetical protein
VCQKEGKRGVSEKWGSCEIEWNGDRKWNEGETRVYGIYTRRSIITTTPDNPERRNTTSEAMHPDMSQIMTLTQWT